MTAGPGDAAPPERMPGGKDVTWVPTCDAVIARMLDMTGVTGADRLIDLGAGDGRMVIAAARRGARALGVEYDADKVELARHNAEAAGVAGRAEFVRADLFEFDFSGATVLTLFLLPALNLRLRPAVLAMRPGTRVATNTFDFADWEADEKFEVPPPECTAHCWALRWRVPARVAGVWRMGDGRVLDLRQAFQAVGGLAKAGRAETAVGGRLRGEEIVLVVGGEVLRGRVQGDTMEGEGWRAARE